MIEHTYKALDELKQKIIQLHSLNDQLKENADRLNAENTKLEEQFTTLKTYYSEECDYGKYYYDQFTKIPVCVRTFYGAKMLLDKE